MNLGSDNHKLDLRNLVDEPTIVEDAQAAQTYAEEIGGFNGTYVLKLTPEMVQALSAGKLIVCGVSGHEYGVVLYYPKEPV